MKRVRAKSEGWSDWQYPTMTGYRMGCCDCGLVHDMEFKVMRVTKRNEDGSWEGEELDPAEFRVSMRAKRNNRSTAQVRRGDAKRKAGGE